MSVTASTSGSLTLTDSAASTSTLSKVLAGTFAGTECSTAQSLLVGTSATPLTLPLSPINFLYIKNLSGAATLTVSWTPNGGASATVLTLQPGAYIHFAEPVAGSGVTAVSVQASAISTPIEFWLLG